MSNDSVLERLDIVREALQTVPSVLLVGLSGLLSIVIFAQLLTQAQVGLYSVGLSIVMLVNALAIGIGLAVKKKASEDNSVTPFYLSSGLLFLSVWLAISVSVLLISIPLLQQYTAFKTLQIYTLSFFVVTHSLFTLVREFISGVGYPGKAEIGAVFRAVIMLVSQIALVTVVSYGVTGLFVGGGLGYSIGTVALLIFGWKQNAITVRPPSVDILKEVYQFSKWSVLDQTLSTSYRWFDTVVVFVIGGAAASGQFKIIYTVVTGAVMFANGIRKPAYVKLSNKHSNDEDIIEISRKVTNNISTAAVGAMFGLLILGNEILGLIFGPVYAQGRLAVVLLAIFMIFFTQRIAFEMFYYVQDKPKISMRMNILVVITFLGLLAIQYAIGTATQYPILTVSATLLAAEIVRYCAYLLTVYMQTETLFISRTIPENIVSGAGMGLVLYALKTYVVAVETLPILFGVIFIGVCVYVAIEELVFNRLSKLQSDIL